MSMSIEPAPSWAAPLAPPLDAGAVEAARWREAAQALRRLAAAIPPLAHDLAAFHRRDVWQGAVATRFGDDLERWRSRLGRDGASADGLDLTGELRAVADRLDTRATAVETSGTGADPSWWGWRGQR
ncbi:MAG: hypothetical protein ACXV95_11650 [Acidimicrobiales bacterium]